MMFAAIICKKNKEQQQKRTCEECALLMPLWRKALTDDNHGGCSI